MQARAMRESLEKYPQESNMMRGIFLTLVVASNCLPSVKAESLDGTWVTCHPDMVGQRNPYTLSSIEREGFGYVVRNEWGVAYSFSGRAAVVGGELVVRGCTYYRGELTNGCDDENPPIVSASKIAVSEPKTDVEIDNALGSSLAIRTDGHAWQKLAARCEEIVEAIKNRSEGSK